MSQDSYSESIEYIPIDEYRIRNKDFKVTEDELYNLRSAVGQLNWLSCVTRPDIAFDVSVLSSNVKEARISDLIYANKVIRRVKNDKSHIRFSPLDLSSVSIVSFADASYNNLKDGGSQGGHIVGGEQNYAMSKFLKIHFF